MSEKESRLQGLTEDLEKREEELKKARDKEDEISAKEMTLKENEED